MGKNVEVSSALRMFSSLLCHFEAVGRDVCEDMRRFEGKRASYEKGRAEALYFAIRVDRESYHGASRAENLLVRSFVEEVFGKNPHAVFESVGFSASDANGAVRVFARRVLDAYHADPGRAYFSREVIEAELVRAREVAAHDGGWWSAKYVRGLEAALEG